MIRQDLRYASRVLRKNPTFTVVSALTIALAIGANTVVFSIVDGVLLRDLPYEGPDRLVRVWGTIALRGDDRANLSERDFLDLRSQNQVFEDMAAFTWTGGGVTLTGPEGVEHLRLVFVSSGFFRVLGVEPERGRTFRLEEEQPGNEGVVVLSHGLWARRFGSDPAIVGKTVTLNGVAHAVVGVMPRDFEHPEPVAGQEPEVWVPLAIDTAHANRGSRYLRSIARLKSGVSLAQARDDVAGIARRLEASYPLTNTGRGVTIETLRDAIVGNVRQPLLLLFVAVAVVLLIACANVANLLLARAQARRKEVAIRAAVGAGRGRLVTQLLTESVLIGLVAGMAGLALAVAATDAWVSMAAGSIPRSASVEIDARVIGFAGGVSLLTGLLFGVVPALGISRARLQDTLKDVPSSGSGDSRYNLSRKMLVIIQTALAFALVAGAGLLIRSYLRLENVDPGFDPKRVITSSLSLSPTRYSEREQQGAFTRMLLARLQEVPGIESVAVVDYLPLGGGYSCDVFIVDAEPPPPPGEEPCAEYRRVSSEYFRSMGIRLLQGRVFSESAGENAPPVAVIDETLARRFWREKSPIGERVTVHGISHEILGIVAGVRHFGLDREAPSGLYVPYLEGSTGEYALVARTNMELSTFHDVVRKEVSALDPDLPVYNIHWMEELLSRSVAQPRFRASLLGLFAAAALILATVGVYGVVYQSTSTRSREMAVRMALGARRTDIRRMVLREGFQLGAAGSILGLLLTLGFTRFLSSFLFEIRSFDPVTFAGVGGFLLSSVLLASYLPARRASRIEPNTVLRYE